jgi:hypothetical protein
MNDRFRNAKSSEYIAVPKTSEDRGMETIQGTSKNCPYLVSGCTTSRPDNDVLSVSPKGYVAFRGALKSMASIVSLLVCLQSAAAASTSGNCVAHLAACAATSAAGGIASPVLYAACAAAVVTDGKCTPTEEEAKRLKEWDVDHGCTSRGRYGQCLN